jgi:hypothetical protein
MTRALMGASENCRVVLALEGGYHPRGVADCVAEVVAAMTDDEAGRAAAAEVISCTENNDTLPFLYLFISAVAHKATSFAAPSSVHEHTRAAVKETKERLSAHWKL